MLFKCLVLATLAVSAWGRSATPALNSIEEPRAQESSGFFGDLRYVYKVYKECAAKDLTPCLKLKLISAMDRAARNYAEVPLIDGVSFVKNENSVSLNEIKSEEELEATLPRALTERDTALNTMISDKIANFFDSHTLQVKFPTGLTEESRKKKNQNNLFLIPLILGGTIIPLALGALALLAGKALIVSKLALVLAGIIGLKKLLGGGGGSEGGHEVVVNGGHGSSWGRSYEKEHAQNLAYSAYAPQA